MEFQKHLTQRHGVEAVVVFFEFLNRLTSFYVLGIIFVVDSLDSMRIRNLSH